MRRTEEIIDMFTSPWRTRSLLQDVNGRTSHRTRDGSDSGNWVRNTWPNHLFRFRPSDGVAEPESGVANNWKGLSIWHMPTEPEPSAGHRWKPVGPGPRPARLVCAPRAKIRRRMNEPELIDWRPVGDVVIEAR